MSRAVGMGRMKVGTGRTNAVGKIEMEEREQEKKDKFREKG